MRQRDLKVFIFVFFTKIDEKYTIILQDHWLWGQTTPFARCADDGAIGMGHKHALVPKTWTKLSYGPTS